MKNKKLRGAITGYGFISSQGHAPAYQNRSDIEIIAIADICDERLKIASKNFPEAKLYSDYSTLIKEQATHLDFVDISTPPAFHFEMAALALENRLHVLCEKPLTTNVAESAQLVTAALKARRVLFPVHNYRHAPVVKAIQKIIESGRIGTVRAIYLNTFRNTHAKGVPEWNTDWRRQKKFSGGGIAMDHGSHSLYLAFDWLKSFPTSVTAKMSTLDKELYDTEDNYSCVLTFPTGIAQLQLSWTAGVRKVTYSIQGDKGAITIDDDELQIAEKRATAGPEVAQGAVEWVVERQQISSNWMDASHVTWFSSLFDSFAQAIEKSDFVSRDLTCAIRCIEVITTSYRSSGEKSRELAIESINL